MHHFRFSLLGLAGLVALIALGCTSLVYASRLSGVVWSATFLLLVFATLAAVLRTQPHRSWWLGFALFGWMYLLTMVGPLSGLSAWLQVDKLLERAAWMMPGASTTTITATMDPFLVTRGMPGAMPGGMGMGGAGMPGMPTGTIQMLDTAYISAVVRTSQAWLTLLLACLGGFAGRLIYAKNRLQHSS